MLANEAAEVVIELDGDGRSAAKTIDRALRDLPKGRFFKPTLAGRIHFPEATFWREHGAMVIGPLAEFKGSIQERDDRSTLVGQISSPAGRFLLSKPYAALLVASALAVVAIGASTGRAKGVTEGLGVAAVIIFLLLLTRRSVRWSGRKQSDLLIRELRRFVSTNVKTDS